MMEDVVSIQESSLGVAHDRTLATLNTLARLLRDTGQSQRQSEVLRQIVLAREHTLTHSPSPKEISFNKQHYERLLNAPRTSPLAAGNSKTPSSSMSDAACLVEEVIEVQYRTSVGLGLETAQNLHRLAMLLLTCEALPDAKRLLVRSITLSENTLGATGSLTLECKAGLVSTLLKNGIWWRAQKLSLGVLEAMRETLGDEHPNTLSIRMDHAMTLVGQKQWKEAEALFRELVEANARVFGESHRQTLAAMTQLGNILEDCARWEEAEHILIDVMKRSRTSLGRDNPDVIGNMAQLASIYASQDQDRWAEFEVVVKEIMDMEAWGKGNIHPRTLLTMVGLAFQTGKYGRREHAVFMLSECIKVLEVAYDDNDPILRKSRYYLLIWKREDAKEITKQEDVAILGQPATMGVPCFWQRWVTYFSPPAAGYERLYFRCGCGKLLSMDLREVVPGGINRLRQRLERSAANVRSRAATTGSSSSGHPTVPPPAHLSGSTPSAFGTYSGTVNSGVGFGGSSLQAQTPGQPTVETAGQLQRPETGGARVDDERRANVQTYPRRWFSKFWHRFVASLPDLPRVAAMFKPMKKAWTGHLYQVSNGDFVRFNLVPIRLRLSPRNFKTKELPPQKEIEELRYIYDPRPMEVEYYDIPLDHLMEPGQHLDDFWLTTFPTKLREPLVRRGGVSGGIPREPCIGWGIRMNEEVSKIYIFRLLHIAVVLVLVVTILHGKFVASWGTELGQFLLAILVLWLLFQYHVWTQGSGDNAAGDPGR
ncbi:Kinesin light chain 5 [Verticillium dahliae]